MARFRLGDRTGFPGTGFALRTKYIAEFSSHTDVDLDISDSHRPLRADRVPRDRTVILTGILTGVLAGIQSHVDRIADPVAVAAIDGGFGVADSDPGVRSKPFDDELIWGGRRFDGDIGGSIQQRYVSKDPVAIAHAEVVIDHLGHCGLAVGSHHRRGPVAVDAFGVATSSGNEPDRARHQRTSNKQELVQQPSALVCHPASMAASTKATVTASVTSSTYRSSRSRSLTLDVAVASAVDADDTLAQIEWSALGVFEIIDAIVETEVEKSANAA